VGLVVDEEADRVVDEEADTAAEEPGTLFSK
jgi:hypothetical protein